MRYGPLADEIKSDRAYTSVTVMDLGSDLLYGAPPSEVIPFLRNNIERWLSQGSKVAVVPVFEESIASLGPKIYPVLRKVFYPDSRLTLEDLSRGAVEINVFLRDLASEQPRLELIEGCSEYIGPDHLHYIQRSAFMERLRRTVRE